MHDTDHRILRLSGALDGRADVVMTMYRDRKFLPKSGEKANFMALSTDEDHGGKNRSASTETLHGLYLSERLSSAVFRQLSSESMSKASRYVLDHLVGRMTVAQFEAATGQSTSTATRYLKDAVTDGIAVTEKRENSAAVYWLADMTKRPINFAAMVAEQNGA
jgi:hypothetical protein